MRSAYIMTGDLIDERTVKLHEELLLRSHRVRLVVEPLDEKTSDVRPMHEVMAEIRQRQSARGFVTPSAQSVEERVAGERDAWND